ncbi:Hsp70 ATPase ssc1, partial [Friedmanniomyces endolithicus]
TGEGSLSAEELKAKTDELQNASLTLFDKMHRARNEASSSEAPPTGEQQPADETKDGEKKP